MMKKKTLLINYIKFILIEAIFSLSIKTRVKFHLLPRYEYKWIENTPKSKQHKFGRI